MRPLDVTLEDAIVRLSATGSRTIESDFLSGPGSNYRRSNPGPHSPPKRQVPLAERRRSCSGGVESACGVASWNLIGFPGWMIAGAFEARSGR